jgi:chromosome segregation ATPase
MIDAHAEFKDTCQELETRIDEIAVDLRNLPTDYKLAEKYADIDREICEVSEWYDTKKQELIDFHKRYWKERNAMEARAYKINDDIKKFNNQVQTLKLREFSHAQHGGSYSQLSPFLHQ